MRLQPIALPLALAGGLALLVSLRAPSAAPAPSAAVPPTETAAPAPGAAHYRIDGTHSSLVFRVKHVGTAYFYGRFNELSGSIIFDPEDMKNCSVQVEVQADSIDTNAGQRDGHLKSSDFFDAKQFPSMYFTSAEVEHLEGDHYRVTGDLEIRGRKKELTFEMQKTGEGEFRGTRIGFEATLTIQRSDYGISYMPEGLGEEVTLMISLESVLEEV